jgi:hypothetical protein
MNTVPSIRPLFHNVAIVSCWFGYRAEAQQFQHSRSHSVWVLSALCSLLIYERNCCLESIGAGLQFICACIPHLGPYVCSSVALSGIQSSLSTTKRAKNGQGELRPPISELRIRTSDPETTHVGIHSLPPRIPLGSPATNFVLQPIHVILTLIIPLVVASSSIIVHPAMTS